MGESLGELELEDSQKNLAASGFNHELTPLVAIIEGYSGLISLRKMSQQGDAESYLSDLKQKVRQLHGFVARITQAGEKYDKNKLSGLIDEISDLENPSLKDNSAPDLPNYLKEIAHAQRQIPFIVRELFSLPQKDSFFFGKFMNITRCRLREILAEKNTVLYYQQDRLLETSVSYRTELSNLIGNAIKHGFPDSEEKDQGSTNRVIRVTVRTNYDPFMVRVHDNGIGIDPNKIYQQALESGIVDEKQDLSRKQKLALVFEEGISTVLQGADLPITPAMSNGLYGTSDGSGLYIVRKLVERKGGKVEVRSRPGNTRFYFTIPRKNVVSSALNLST